MFFRGSVEKASSWRWIKLRIKKRNLKQGLAARTCGLTGYHTRLHGPTAYVGGMPLRRASDFPATQGTDNRLT